MTILDQQRSESDPTLKLFLMGSLVIELHGETMASLASRSVTAMFIYLMAHERPIPRETLADFFWDERTQAQASANLRATLSRLRKRLGDYLVVTRQTVGFDHQPGGYWVDAFAIEHTLQQQLAQDKPDIAALEQALAWYKGDFLAGFYLSESRGFEEWIVVQRERLRHLAVQALGRVVEHHLEAANYPQSLAYAQRWVTLDPLDEAAHRQLMWLHMRGGKRNAALQQYRKCQKLLDEELGVEPERRTTDLFDRFRTLSVPPPLHLPELTTPFVGRQKELAQIIDRSQRHSLLTIIGPGGMGKTTLAIKAAHYLAQQSLVPFLDGVFYVPLAGLPSATLLADAIAAALGVNPQNAPGPESYLIDYLSDRELLLVLDNFEHSRSDSSRHLLKRLIENAPGLKIIIASRQRVGLAAEHVFDLQGLDYPGPESTGDVTEHDAVQLFVQHAQRLRPDFTLTQAGVAAIADICQLVQGMPLGLELAASWTRLFDCATIRDRIQENIDLLDAGQPDEHGRPRSLRATFDYTWTSLSPVERRALKRMAVFQGPFEIAAAEHVAAADPVLLQNLVDKSLLRHDGADLWSLHSLFRQYCAEKLAHHDPDQQSALRRHTTHYLRLVQDTAVALRQARQQGRRADREKQRVRREIDNVRAACERLYAYPELTSAERLIQFVDDFGLFLFHESWYQEAAMLYAQALAEVEPEAMVGGRWWRELARAYLGLGQPDKANDHFVKALACLGQPAPRQGRGLRLQLVRQLLKQLRFRFAKTPQNQSAKDIRHASEAIQIYDQLSRTYYYAGQTQAFGYCALRSLNLAEESNIQAARARGYANLCLGLGFLRKHTWAQSYLEQAHGIAASLDDAPSRAYVHLVTGVYDGMVGIWQRSDASLQQAIQIYRQLGDMQQWGEGFSVYCTNLYAQGRFQETAEQRLILAETARKVGNQLHEAWGLSGRAAALLVLDQVDEAMALLQQSTEKLISLNSPQNVLSAQALLGQAYLRNENWQKALTLANSVMEMKDETAPTFATNVAVFESVCIIYLRLLDLPPELISTLGLNPIRLLDKIGQISAALVDFAKVAKMGQPRALIYRAGYLWRLGKERQAIKVWRQAIASAAKLNMPYDQARAQYELGRHLSEHDPERGRALSDARQGFEDVGATYDLRLP